MARELHTKTKTQKEKQAIEDYKSEEGKTRPQINGAQRTSPWYQYYAPLGEHPVSEDQFTHEQARGPLGARIDVCKVDAK